MKPIEEADIAFRKSINETLGYLELMQLTATTSLCQQALEALQRFSDNDDYIDAMYDEDMRLEVSDE